MLHRALFGSLERFIGILIEHHAGTFPAWLAPVQVAVLNITDAQAGYVRDVAKRLQQEGFRSITDLRNEKIGYKIREHTMARIPYLIVIGDREMAGNTLAVRELGGKDLGTMTFDDFANLLRHSHTCGEVRPGQTA